MARRQRIDSAAAAVSVVSLAQRSIAPPVKLSKDALPYFNRIVAARPVSEWNEADLVTACRLARAEAVAQDTPDSDVASYDKLCRLALAIRRSLGLDVRGKDGRAGDVAKRRAATFEIEQSAKDGASSLLN